MKPHNEEEDMQRKTIAAIFAIVLAICLLLALEANIGNIAFATRPADSSDDYLSNVNRSLALYDKVINSYIVEKTYSKERELITYSEDFAGVFIDEQGILNLGVISAQKEINKLQTQSQYAGQIIYKQFTYPYNYLQKIMSGIEAVMLENNVLAVGIDDKLNQVFVELTSENDLDNIISYLRNNDLYDEGALAFSIIPGASNHADQKDTAYGGESIYYPISNDLNKGTICVNAVDNATGLFGILTNAHVAPSGTAMTYGRHWDGSTMSVQIPFGVSYKSQQGGTVDAAFVPFENQDAWGIANKSRYNTTTYGNIKLGTESQIVSGQPVTRIGQTTGVTTGEIRSTNVSITIGDSSFTNTFRYTNDGQGGDSGGPVYYDDGTNKHLIGMHFASGEVILGGRQGYACRIRNVMNVLDVTPLTDDYLVTSDLSDGGIQIDKVNFDISYDLTIPTDINDRLVTSIGAHAFRDQINMTKVTIPIAVKTIGPNAFQNCSSLRNAFFDVNCTLTSIGNAAFNKCTGMTTISLPQSITSIGANAFEDCTALIYMIFQSPSSLTSIGNSAYANCSSLSTFTVPAGVTTIGANTFSGCSGLSKVYFDSGLTLTSIGNSAFANCGSLTNINLPSSLTSIGYDVFYNCSSLESVVISNNVTSIGGNAFRNCSKLTIYTSRTSAPSGWVSGWNTSNRPVVWGCSLSTGLSYVISFTKSSTNPTNSSAVNGIKNPYRRDYNFGGWYTNSDFSGTQYTDLASAPNGTLYAKWNSSSCVSEGTLITLADGSRVAVEDLSGDELLLVWNFFTGTFDIAPILFIDSDSYMQYEIIHLYFSDGTSVKVISEHAFWDFDLNKYVFLRNDAAQYIGHRFNKQSIDSDGKEIWAEVQLIDVAIYSEYTTAWSPVTYGHLCLYVNGMLSMPGSTEGLINIFTVDASSMQYDAALLANDIATYGLFTYEEFCQIIEVPEIVFEAFNGQYLKISIGKGLITINDIIGLIERYSGFFSMLE
jgi:uncharacterized repeat protein (TIGR02543 family)